MWMDIHIWGRFNEEYILMKTSLCGWTFMHGADIIKNLMKTSLYGWTFIYAMGHIIYGAGQSGKAELDRD